MGLVENWSHSASNRQLARSLWKVFAQLSIGGVRHRALLKLTSKNHRILDVGCGGGIPWLSDYGHVTGMDSVPVLLEQAKNFYAETVQHDIGKPFPLPDDQFTLALMNDVVAHVDDATLANCASELRRVLKHGGLLISAMECDQNGLIYRIGRTNRECFQKNYIESPGHQFIRTLEKNLEFFTHQGFSVKDIICCAGAVGDLSILIPRGTRLPKASHRALVAIDRLCSIHPLVGHISNVLFSPASRMLSKPENSALCVCTLELRKNPGSTPKPKEH